MKIFLSITISLACVLISPHHCIPIDDALVPQEPVVISAVATGDAEQHVAFDSHPKYDYSYGVKDPLTGDDKEHHESRDGDEVHGSYSVVEPDGSRRIVEYTADAIHGFNAIVRREPPAVQQLHNQEAPIVAHHLPIVAHQAYHHAPLITHHEADLVAAQHLPVTLPHHHHAPSAITHQATYKFTEHAPTFLAHTSTPVLHAPAAYVH